MKSRKGEGIVFAFFWAGLIYLMAYGVKLALDIPGLLGLGPKLVALVIVFLGEAALGYSAWRLLMSTLRYFDISLWMGWDSDNYVTWRVGTYKMQRNMRSFYVSNFHITFGWPLKKVNP